MDSKTFLDILKLVVNFLRTSGYEATVEYPGYIAIGKRSYGTANGNWGWSDEDGNGGETDLTGECMQSDTIATEILKIERYFDGTTGPTKAYGSDEEYLQDVSNRFFDASSYAPQVIHTGGGIYNLAVFVDDRVQLRFGTSDENWGADVYVDGEFIDGASINSTEKIEEDRPGNAALVISRMTERFRTDVMPTLIANVDKKAKREAADRGFREAVSQFHDSAIFLNRMWDSVSAESEYREIPYKDYPFNESFEEVAYKIGLWLTAVKRD